MQPPSGSAGVFRWSFIPAWEVGSMSHKEKVGFFSHRCFSICLRHRGMSISFRRKPVPGLGRDILPQLPRFPALYFLTRARFIEGTEQPVPGQRQPQRRSCLIYTLGLTGRGKGAGRSGSPLLPAPSCVPSSVAVMCHPGAAAFRWHRSWEMEEFVIGSTSRRCIAMPERFSCPTPIFSWGN